jgi:hypothetical protein
VGLASFCSPPALLTGAILPHDARAGRAEAADIRVNSRSRRGHGTVGWSIIRFAREGPWKIVPIEAQRSMRSML